MPTNSDQRDVMNPTDTNRHLQEINRRYNTASREERRGILRNLLLYDPAYREIFAKFILYSIETGRTGGLKQHEKRFNAQAVERFAFRASTLLERLLSKRRSGRINHYKDRVERGHLIPNEDFLIFRKLVRPDDVVLNIGAHNGLTALFLEYLGVSEIHSFEPHPDFFNLVSSLTIKNHTAHNIALSRETGTRTLHAPEDHPGRSTLDPDRMTESLSDFGGGHGTHRTFTVNTRTLDSLGFGQTGYWKIDAEGSELDILEGAKTLLSTRPPRAIQLEIWREQYPDLQRFLGTYYQHHYHCRIDQGFTLRFMRVTPESLNFAVTLRTPIFIFTNEALG